MKKFIAMALSLVLVAGLSIGGTVAYLQDTDKDVNTMTLGNVDIAQVEQQRDENGNLVDFVNDKPAYPVVSTLPGMYDWADTLITMPNGGTMKVFHPEMKNVVDKFISVKNTGTSDAYVRTIIAIEDPANTTDGLVHVNVNATEWTQEPWADVTINGTHYSYAVFTYPNVLAKDESTPFSLAQVFLDEDGTNEDCAAFGDKWEILSLSQAVQAAGFADAATALNTAFGEADATNVAEWFEDTSTNP